MKYHTDSINSKRVIASISILFKVKKVKSNKKGKYYILTLFTPNCNFKN